jgi:hypothetical protein
MHRKRGAPNRPAGFHEPRQEDTRPTRIGGLRVRRPGRLSLTGGDFDDGVAQWQASIRTSSASRVVRRTGRFCTVDRSAVTGPSVPR